MASEATTAPGGSTTDIRIRKYLASVASFCAYACSRPDTHELRATVRALRVDVPRTLARLERAA